MPLAENLYVHFPFCRRKCAYCALHSRVGVSASARRAYVESLVRAIAARPTEETYRTVYFGGGSPALCDLGPLLAALGPRRAPDCEFTVELHPLDVTDDLLARLAADGVNRISMGVQSLDDATLVDMGRGYSVAEAARAFARVRTRFENAGIDLIVGYPGDSVRDISSLGSWGLRHCSVYSLILEEKSILSHRLAGKDPPRLPNDDETLDRLGEMAAALAKMGLRRYEISNHARAGFECRHNLAVWRGEDYLGLGDGAFGRLGLSRTENLGCPNERIETVDPARDALERTLFRLRTREGLDASEHPEWLSRLDGYVRDGLLTNLSRSVYRLTARGTEVCDAILADLI